MKKERKALLQQMIDCILAEDIKGAEKAFSKYNKIVASQIMKEMFSNFANVKALGKGIDDPVKGKSSADVVATRANAVKSEIRKSSKSFDEPKKAKSSADVVATRDRAAKAEIR
jgi:hypothetical protein